ncbi:MAG: hypothetical protein EOM25_14645 [Deltaproteobacteria bacterium]|nr:hypothetical protein [Deltaproteobacteria bacterium]
MHRRNFAEFTRYPHLFRDTYWGRFEVPPNDMNLEIFENRNLFVKEFQIVRQSNDRLSPFFHDMQGDGHGWPDHREAYRTKGKGFVLTFHNYVGNDYTHPAFTAWKPMYHAKAITYVATFPDYETLRRALS